MDRKTLALFAHDNRKQDMVEWVEENWEKLMPHKLVCTGTTGKLVEDVLTRMSKEVSPLNNKILKLKSGPLGGDQQMGAMIAEGNIDILIFLWDPMQPQPHDVDVKALLRIASVYNIPTATNRSTADFIIESTLLNSKYIRKMKDYSGYINRNVSLGE